jgi:hypothetical protein
MEVEVGTLLFNSSSTLSSSGTYSVTSPGTLGFQTSTILGGTIAGDGSVVFSGGVIDIDLILDIEGSYE